MPELLPLSEDKIIWAEEVEAETQLQASSDTLPQRQEFTIDDQKTIIDYYRNDDDKLVKTVSKYRIETKRVSVAVAHRRKLKKFGHAKDDPPGPNIANTGIGEAIKIQFVRSRGGELLELTKNEDDILAKLMQKGANMLRCRFCKSTDHMSAYCPYKDLVENTMETLESVSSGDAATDEKSRQKELEDKVKSGTYVPPSMLRAGAGGAPPSRSMDTSRRDDFTVRVTNLPEETIEEDLKELFGNVGKVQRVFLAKDKSTGRCKGFAFVTFCNREDAEKGIQTISGHKYDHLILKVEWARPLTRMPEILVVPLGAGQEVGRSCILVSIGGKNVMLDCGMHMGFNDDRRFPDFSYISGQGNRLDGYLDCVIISHFHLDHCGALPYMSEMVGYNGPIYMTYPTKAICPELLEDYRKIQVDVKKETKFFNSQMIADCMKKCVPVNLHEVVQVDKDLRIKAYYAGHVLGAAMFEIRVGSESVVYTGDFNMTPDRHLGAAEIDRTCPDLLISESTYATTIRDSKRARERDFLKKVHDCVDKGGKVLIPTFALGRAQELCILLESYWERMNLKIPIYFTMGLTRKPFDNSYADLPGPMVVFATPGMLHSGTSLQIFKKWAPNEKNMVIMPGYCVAGTCGAKIISGAKRLDFEGKQSVEVKLAVEYMSFSAHADAKGIMQLIRNCRPKHVMFVHGEDLKMEFLKQKVEKEFGVPVFKPANGETVSIPTDYQITVDVDSCLIKRCIADDPTPSKRRCPFSGTLIYDEKRQNFKVVDQAVAVRELGLEKHELDFTNRILLKQEIEIENVAEIMQRIIDNDTPCIISPDNKTVQIADGKLTINFEQDSTQKSKSTSNFLCCSFSLRDYKFGQEITHKIKSQLSKMT